MKKWLLYSVYVIAVLAAFLYLLFPSDEFRQYIVHRAAAADPSVTVRLEKVAPRLPPGLVLFDLGVSLRGRPVFDVSELQLTPRYASLFSASKAFHVKGKAYEGSLEGRASFQTRGDQAYSADITFEQLAVDQMDGISGLVPYQLSGRAEGRVRYRSNAGVYGEGETEVMVKEAFVNFTPSLFGFQELSLGTVTAKASLTGDVARITDATIEGLQMSGDAKGSIALRQPLDRSRINLTGTLKLHPSFIKEISRAIPPQLFSIGDFVDKGIPFRITGSIREPKFSLR
jgi:type II secretion system protein N